VTSPPGPRTGEFSELQWRSSKPPPSASGRRIGVRCAGIASGRRAERTRSSEARRLATPSASGSAGSSGNASNTGLPTISPRVVIVARR
jgi:hypothetical protein